MIKNKMKNIYKLITLSLLKYLEKDLLFLWYTICKYSVIQPLNRTLYWFYNSLLMKNGLTLEKISKNLSELYLYVTIFLKLNNRIK